MNAKLKQLILKRIFFLKVKKFNIFGWVNARVENKFLIVNPKEKYNHVLQFMDRIQL